MFRKSLHAAALVTTLVSASGTAQSPTFVFTAIPDQNETRLVERFSRFAKYLDAKLGVPVKYVPVKTYPAAVTAFINNDVQLAWFGGFTGVQARHAVPGAIAQGAEEISFKSYFIANSETGLKFSKDFPAGIEGKNLSLRLALVHLWAGDARILHP
jgi:phosphonate transport system substrate-binding protein